MSPWGKIDALTLHDAGEDRLPINRGQGTDRSGLAFLPVDAEVYGSLFPCQRCAVWFVTVDRYDGGIVIREWHEETCPVLPASAQL